MTFEHAVELAKRQEVATKQINLSHPASLPFATTTQLVQPSSVAPQTDPVQIQILQTLSKINLSLEQTSKPEEPTSSKSVSFARRERSPSYEVQGLGEKFGRGFDRVCDRLENLAQGQKELAGRITGMRGTESTAESRGRRHCDNCGYNNHFTNQCRFPPRRSGFRGDDQRQNRDHTSRPPTPASRGRNFSNDRRGRNFSNDRRGRNFSSDRRGRNFSGDRRGARSPSRSGN